MRHLMGEERWQRLIDTAHPRTHSAGATLLRQHEPGTHVLALRSGVAKVLLREQGGGLTLLAFRGPGELLGEVAVLDGGGRSAGVLAITPCAVSVIDRAAFLRLADEEELSPLLIRYALGRLRESDTARGGGDVTPRLAAALVQLAEMDGEQPAGGAGPRDLALTRNELAQYLGVSRNTVTTALAELGPARVRTGRGRVHIGDLQALRTAAAPAWTGGQRGV
ncbi:Crp/Fnr family transcriptional regulator [Streptomyces bohaiensis]|uniref:Crp/Fnr family transcriptional regulator n=2 Tax=Streptomyces bohaiensis TaxID=1431344 RepID=A0ABX1CKI1_9ACTN|nr:Crp/Fnr family transcriptional regulator [Streptomyces bohaiensis]